LSLGSLDSSFRVVWEDVDVLDDVEYRRLNSLIQEKLRLLDAARSFF